MKTLAVSNYRSLLKLNIKLGRLNVVTGPNGVGKSNLYRALRLLAETAQGDAQGGVVSALAREGGLASTLWAGPENLSRRMRSGEVGIEGSPRQKRVRLRLGFATEHVGYAVSFGLPAPSLSAFALDPEIKRECIWSGAFYRPGSLLVDRTGPVIKIRTGKGWQTTTESASGFDSVFTQVADPSLSPDVFNLREAIRSWRFYDHFRLDREAPVRQPQLGTRTPVLHHDGHDLAAALQTIREVGDAVGLREAIDDAFPGAEVNVAFQSGGQFAIEFRQEGLLRPLSIAELSDGTLRYLLWAAALLTPRPPALMVLNEPETSLHPDLVPALARLIVRAAEHTQVWVVSHAESLIHALSTHPRYHAIALEKSLGQTQLVGQGPLDEPAWHWPD